MARILLFGYYGFGNFGDELLLASIKQHLSDHDLTVISGNCKQTENLHQLKAISRKQFWLNPGSYDIFLVGGGSILQNTTSNRSLIYYLGAIKRAQHLGMDVYLMAQGLGPLRGIWSQMALKSLRGIHLTVRDRQSLTIAQNCGLKADLVADLALSYSNYPPKKQGKVIGIALRDGFGLNSFLQLDWLLTDNIEKRLFAFHNKDYELCLKVARFLPNAHTVKMEKLQDLEYFSDLELLWGMRLHSLIVATAMGIPALGISYDPKVTAFCEEAGISWHLPGIRPKKEWFRSGDTGNLIKRSETAWQLFRDCTKAGTSGHSI